MPDIPKHHARITPKPVGKAPLPVSAADVGAGAVGAGLQQVGKGVGDIGNVLIQIKQEQIALSDAINETKANASIQAEKNRFSSLLQTDMGHRGDGAPDDWDIGNDKSFDQMVKEIETLPFSSKAAQQMQAEIEALREIRKSELRTAKTYTLNKQLRAFLPQNLEDAIASNDPLIIDAALGLFALKRKSAWGSDKVTAETVYKKAISDGKKRFYIDQSKLFPDEIIAEMQKSKKDLGKGGVDEFGLSAKDFDDVIASAYNAKTLAEKSLDARQEIELEEISTALQSGVDENGQPMDWTYIQSKTSLTSAQKETARLRMNNEAERRAKDIPIAINRPIERDLETMAYRLSSGGSIKEFRVALDNARFPEKGKPFIDDDSHTRIKALGEGKYASYQDEAMHKREVYALGQLVTLPSEDRFARILEGMTSSEQKAAQTIRQLQFDNLDRYKDALRRWREDHPDASADDIYDRGRKLLKHFKKTDEQLKIESETVILPPATDKKLLDAARQVISDAQKGLSGVNTIEKPATLKEFEERMASLSTVDARRRYYQKWYKDVKGK